MKIDPSLLVLDLETSGVNPFKNDVLAVGMVPLHNPAAARTIYVRPTSEICWNDYAKRNFEKFSNEWETGAVSPAEACDQIEAFVREVMPGQRATLVGHNVGFDQAFLRKLAFAGGREQLKGISHRAIDTHTVLYLLHCQDLVPGTALSSDGAFQHFHINIESKVRHTAEADALATRELICRAFELLETRSRRSSQPAVA